MVRKLEDWTPLDAITDRIEALMDYLLDKMFSKK